MRTRHAFSCFIIGYNQGIFWLWKWTLGSHKRRLINWPNEKLSSCQEESCLRIFLSSFGCYKVLLLTYPSVSLMHFLFYTPVKKAGERSRHSDKLRVPISGKGKIFYLLHTLPYQLWGPPSLLLNEYRNSYTGIKRPGRDVDPSPTSTAEVKNEWSYTTTPPICLSDVGSDNFTFTYQFT